MAFFESDQLATLATKTKTKTKTKRIAAETGKGDKDKECEGKHCSRIPIGVHKDTYTKDFSGKDTN